MDRTIERLSAWFGRGLVDPITYAAVRTAMTPIHLAGLGPARRVARSLGARFGRMPFNRERVERAVERLGVAIPEFDEQRRREIVLASYEHLFELGVEFALAPRLLNEDGWSRHVEIAGVASGVETMLRDGPVIIVTAHCGNWEIAGYTLATLGFPIHVLYRPLDVQPLDQWVRRTRARLGVQLLDKFGAVKQLPELLAAGNLVAFVADQNAGDRGLFVPYFNRLASTYKTIGLMAIRYNAPVLIGQTTRVAGDTDDAEGTLGYRIQITDTIRPGDWADQPDPLYYLTARYRQGIERMVRTAPEQYLWMHRIWKSRPRHERLNRPMPGSMRSKIEQLPWMSEGDVDAIVDRSDRDRAWLAEHDTDRLL